MLGGVLPSAAVALGALDLGIVITASHNPPEYNGVKFFTGRRTQAHATPRRRRSRRCSTRRPRPSAGRIEARLDADAERYIDYVVEHFGSDLDRAATSSSTARTAPTRGLAPEAFERLGASVHAIGDAPDGTNINAGCGATDTRAAPARRCSERGAGARARLRRRRRPACIAVDEHGEVVDGDGIVAILALDLGVDLVAVTQMTNLGFHALMARARDPRRHDRRRRPLRARGARARGRHARRRAVGPRDLPARPRHRRRARRGAAPLRRAARAARSSEAAAVHRRASRSARRTSASTSKELTRAGPRRRSSAPTPSSARRGACSSARPGRSRSSGCSWRPRTASWRGRPVLASQRSSRVSSADSSRETRLSRCCRVRRPGSFGVFSEPAL